MFSHVSPLFFVADAFQHVKENLSDLENAANETDLVFLKGLLDNPAVKQLIKVRKLDWLQMTSAVHSAG